MIETVFLVTYGLVGFVIGARLSTRLAWKIAGAKATESDWWCTPLPFFLLVSCIVGWPGVTLLWLAGSPILKGAMAIGTGMEKILFGPPPHVRRRLAEPSNPPSSEDDEGDHWRYAYVCRQCGGATDYGCLLCTRCLAGPVSPMPTQRSTNE